MSAATPALLRFYSDLSFELYDYVVAEYRNSLDADVVIVRMLAELHTCSAETELGFKRWALKFIRDAATAQQVRDGYSKLTTSELAIVRPATEEPFVTEPHPQRPDVTCVQVFSRKRKSYAWMIATEDLPKAQALWGNIEVRSRVIGGKSTQYLVKVCRRQSYGGSWIEEPTPLAEIWFNSDRYVFQNGNLLDYCKANVTIEEPRPRFVPLDESRATRDWVPAQPTTIGDKPANPVHGQRVEEWLSGNDAATNAIVELENALRRAWLGP